ncbi:MAG: hypothetical protein OEW09_13950 [Anaerolineae bacterium]|nr:hypothetical protein [Anaerolineae bacterium]
MNEEHTPQAASSDEELPIAPDPNLQFWKDTAKGLLGESIKSIEETAKQIIGVAGILEGLYFHAIAYSDIRGQLGGVGPLLLYLLPLLLWLVSLLAALLVFFPRAYASNISSWRESKAAFERIVTYKHTMLKIAGLFLVLGALALFATMGAYLAG